MTNHFDSDLIAFVHESEMRRAMADIDQATHNVRIRFNEIERKVKERRSVSGVSSAAILQLHEAMGRWDAMLAIEGAMMLANEEDKENEQ